MRKDRSPIRTMSPRPSLELIHQALFDQCKGTLIEPGGRLGRFHLHRAVKGKSRLAGPHLGQPAAVAPGEMHHRGKSHLAGLSPPQAGHQGFSLAGERLPAAQQQVGPQQGPGLEVQSRFQVGAEAADRHQGGHAQDDGGGEQQQLSTAGPAVAPSHFPGPGVENGSHGSASGRLRFVCGRVPQIPRRGLIRDSACWRQRGGISIGSDLPTLEGQNAPGLA